MDNNHFNSVNFLGVLYMNNMQLRQPSQSQFVVLAAEIANVNELRISLINR